MSLTNRLPSVVFWRELGYVPNRPTPFHIVAAGDGFYPLQTFFLCSVAAGGCLQTSFLL